MLKNGTDCSSKRVVIYWGWVSSEGVLFQHEYFDPVLHLFVCYLQYERSIQVLKECYRLRPKFLIPILQAAKICYEHLHKVRSWKKLKTHKLKIYGILYHNTGFRNVIHLALGGLYVSRLSLITVYSVMTTRILFLSHNFVK